MTAAGVAAALASALDGRAGQSYGQWCVDVPAVGWLRAVRTAREDHRCAYLDWLSGVDDGDDGFSIVAHVLDPDSMTHLLLRTRISREDPRLASITTIHRGARWHERETAEMYGVSFEGHPDPLPLLLPEGFQGHPLRKDFVLAARAVKDWPGSKEPGESEVTASPGRRRLRPPGVPAPCDWPPAGTGD